MKTPIDHLSPRQPSFWGKGYYLLLQVYVMCDPKRPSEPHILEAHKLQYIGEVLHAHNFILANAVLNCCTEVFLKFSPDTHYFIIQLQQVVSSTKIRSFMKLVHSTKII
jgi:hypothetical protein